MGKQEESDLYRRCLLDVLTPAMTGVFVVAVLMSGLYWLALRSLQAVLQPERVLFSHIAANVGYYSSFTALAVALSAILFLLLAIKYVSYLSRPLQLVEELGNYSPEIMPEDKEQRVRAFVFKKIKERVIVLVSASMTAPFLLMGGLYLAVIAIIYRFCGLHPRESNVLFQVLGHYGTLVLLVIVISAISLITWGIYRLRSSLSLAEVPERRLAEIQKNCPVNCREIEKEIEELLLLADIQGQGRGGES